MKYGMCIINAVFRLLVCQLKLNAIDSTQAVKIKLHNEMIIYYTIKSKSGLYKGVKGYTIKVAHIHTVDIPYIRILTT